MAFDRNPIVGGENSVVLGSERALQRGNYRNDIAPFAAAAIPGK